MKKSAQYVGVDEKFIPEDEKYVDNSLNGEIKDTINDGIKSAKDYLSKDENKQKLKNTGKKVLKVGKGIGIAYLSFIGFIFLMVILVFILVFSSFFKANDRFDETYNKVESTMNGIIDDTINK